jgi:hypothetical protein
MLTFPGSDADAVAVFSGSFDPMRMRTSMSRGAHRASSISS